MKALILITALAAIASCDTRLEEDIPLKEIPANARDTGIETEILNLRAKVSSLNIERSAQGLNKTEKAEFHSRLEELRKSLNQTISLMRTEYSLDQRKKLNLSFSRTKKIWDYIIKNYKI